MFEVASIFVESRKGMTKSELKRIIVSTKRHSLYQLFWVALFCPIGIVGLIISYFIYRKDTSIQLKPFVKWLEASD